MATSEGDDDGRPAKHLQILRMPGACFPEGLGGGLSKTGGAVAPTGPLILRRSAMLVVWPRSGWAGSVLG